ncbi:septal ring lytic transglycosylase RlpA family protein [Comamonas composti]|uniref:septal ring lytic transglycosylase RlpA family protein n=1 Tax=Comamonas composti TaxID=408558 RepID=UPI0004134946|nr:septal ring lytic transglycosylase RlpA family protein [Comamonas composti]
MASVLCGVRCWRWMALGMATALLAGCAPLAQVDEPPAAAPSREAAQPATTLPPPAEPERRPFWRKRDPKPEPQPQPEPAPEKAVSQEPEPEPAAVRDSDQQGMASWYGPGFHGRRTASGERFDKQDLTAAHRSFAFGSRVCVRSLSTGKTVVVRINDRGPYAAGRVIDLSQGAAQELGMVGLGIKSVELWQLEEDEEDCPQPAAAVGKARAKPHAAASKTRPRPAGKRAPAKLKAGTSGKSVR